MNTFCEHHKNSIKFGYRCFDRILLNGLIQPFQQPERVIGFFNAYREARRVTRNLLRDIAQQFQNWLKNRCQKWGVPILDAPEGRRDDFVDPYFKQAKKDEVVVILKAREPARIMVAIGAQERWHLKAMVALVVLRNKAIKPLLAAAQDLRPSRGAQNPRSLDRNYEIIRTAMQVVFQELGLAA